MTVRTPGLPGGIYFQYIAASYGVLLFEQKILLYFAIINGAIYLGLNAAQIYFLVRYYRATAREGQPFTVETSILIWALANAPLLIYGSYRLPAVGVILLCVYALSHDVWRLVRKKSSRTIHPGQVVAWLCLLASALGVKLFGVDSSILDIGFFTDAEPLGILLANKSAWWLMLLIFAECAMIFSLIRLARPSKRRTMAAHSVFTFQFLAILLSISYSWLLFMAAVFASLFIRVFRSLWDKDVPINAKRHNAVMQ